MADETGIEWTGATWNPVRGCSRVSPGCESCYAEHTARRFAGPGQPYEGLLQLEGMCVCGHARKHHKKVQGAGAIGTCERCTACVVFTRGSDVPKPKWNGVVQLVREHVTDPLRWKRPRRIFVNSMSDLFHESLEDEIIAGLLGVMGMARQHEFQILTKRARRMLQVLTLIESHPDGPVRALEAAATNLLARCDGLDYLHPITLRYPFENVLLGVSAEDEQRARERIPFLVRSNAARRFVSYEPAIGPLASSVREITQLVSPLDWIIVGGESAQPGIAPRAFDPQWARDVLEGTRQTRCRVFVKQMGARPVGLRLAAKKGNDMSEWPADLRVRDFPEAVARF
jgi:protein gp37